MSFLNIFSSKKEQNKNKVRILVDIHEKNSIVPSELSKNGFLVEFESLPVGDYIVNDIAIERKTIQDLKSSIINKRIHSQLKSLEHFKKSLLLIEGFSKESYNSGIIHENALRGFILSVLTTYKIPILYSTDSKDSARYISVLAKKSPNSEFALRANKNKMSDKELLEYILEGFPEIGPVTSKKLLSKFDSLKNVFDLDKKSLEDTIGKKSAEMIRLISLSYKDL